MAQHAALHTLGSTVCMHSMQHRGVGDAWRCNYLITRDHKMKNPDMEISPQPKISGGPTRPIGVMDKMQTLRIYLPHHESAYCTPWGYSVYTECTHHCTPLT